MEWGIAINLREPVSEIVEKAIVADTGGLDSVWITDYPATKLSPVLASVVAQKTVKCRIGVGLLSPLIYPPIQIVRFMSSLIRAHGNRFDLLLGPGDKTRLANIGVQYGKGKALVQKMAESLSTVREGLADFKDCRVFFGAQGAKMIEMSRDSDGVFLNYSDPEMVQEAIAALGRTPTGFKIGVFSPTLVGDSVSCDERLGVRSSAAVVALGLSPAMMKRFKIYEGLLPALSLFRERGKVDESVIQLLDQSIIDRFCVCENLEGVCNRMLQFENLGVTMIVFGPPQGADREGVRQMVHAKNMCEETGADS